MVKEIEVVSACSYEARSFGVRSGIYTYDFFELLQIRGDSDQYSYYSNIVTDIVAEDVPLYEKTSIDEFYIDYQEWTNSWDFSIH